MALKAHERISKSWQRMTSCTSTTADSGPAPNALAAVSGRGTLLRRKRMSQRTDAYDLSTRVLHVRVTEEEHEEAHVLARHRKVPVSVLVRNLLRAEADRDVMEGSALSPKEKRMLRTKGA